MLKNLGIRGRLLAAFLGISAFAVLAAVAAMYAFFEVGDSLGRITQQSVPSALASQEVSRHAQRMVAAAGALLTAQTPEEQDALSDEIHSDAERLGELLDEVKRTDIEPAALEQITQIAEWLGLNLISLETVVTNAHAMGERKKDALADLTHIYTAIQTALRPRLFATEADIAQLRKMVDSPALSADERARATTRLSQAIASFIRLQKVQLEAAFVYDTLLKAARVDTPVDLQLLTEPLNRSMQRLRTLIEGLVVDVRRPLQDQLQELSAFTEGRKSIFLVRRRELDHIIGAQRQIAENAELSSKITAAVEQLVKGARQDIAAANREVLAVQRFGSVVLIAVVVLSLISSTLIVWLYVGRNLIGRLTALSDSMLAIAGGNLKADIPEAHGDEIGRMAQALAVFRDTAIEVEESNLREITAARQRLLDAIESIADGFVLFDADDRLVLCNSRYRTALHPAGEADITPGATFEAIIRSAAARGLIRDAADRVDAWVEDRLATHRNPTGPHVQQRGDGSWFRITEYKTADGGMVGVYTDITELMHREAELADANTTMDVVLKTIDYGVLFLDSELRVGLVNRGYHRLWHTAEAFFESKPTFRELMDDHRHSGMYAVPDEDWEDYRKARIKAIKKGNIGPLELALADGKILQYRVIALPGGGRMLTFFDITELKRREAELGELVNKIELARDTAMQATRAKSEFLANMSHELRTPLNAIIGIAELLLEDARELDQEDQIEPFERIHRAGIHLLRLINDLLDLSKIEAGKMELHITEVELAHVIGEVATTAQPLATKNHNRLTVDCPDDIGILRADDIRVRQVLLNLLSNACKFTENGEVRVRVERANDDGIEGVAISVSDTGIGLTPEQISVLFQDFTQADASTTRKYGGTGLGLAISQRFCHLLGGNITVDSTPRQGSTFRIWLPRVVPMSAPGEKRTVAAQATLSKVERPTPAEPERGLAQRTVLVVDDDADVRELLTEFLTREGFVVATAADGAEGLILAREVRPSAIILDVLMPELDGWAVLTACKGDPQLADIPVIMLTIVDDRTRGYALGAAEYLVKPIDRKRLRAVIDKHCDRQGKILLIEDDQITRETMRKSAQRQGFGVVEAANGREALERLGENRPDLILLDLLMPEMNGFEFLAELHKNTEWCDIPVVVITAKDLTVEDRQRLNGRVASIAQKGLMSQSEILEKVRGVIAARTTMLSAELVARDR